MIHINGNWFLSDPPLKWIMKFDNMSENKQKTRERSWVVYPVVTLVTASGSRHQEGVRGARKGSIPSLPTFESFAGMKM